MPQAYKHTSVPSFKSQEEIKKILQRYGVKGIQFSERFETREIVMRFAVEIKGMLRTVHVKIVVPEPPRPKKTRRRATRWVRGRIVYDKTPQEKQEQMNRMAYRFLLNHLKNQFEAVDYGFWSMEDIFLTHFEWMVGGQAITTLELMRPFLDKPQLPEFSGASKGTKHTEETVYDGEVVE